MLRWQDKCKQKYFTFTIQLNFELVVNSFKCLGEFDSPIAKYYDINLDKIISMQIFVKKIK